jgi:hypothetical protein
LWEILFARKTEWLRSAQSILQNADDNWQESPDNTGSAVFANLAERLNSAKRSE